MENNNKRIAALNDRFRRTFAGGKVVMTAGIAALAATAEREEIVRAVRTLRPSTLMDPYGEHDFGAIEVSGRRIFWKIDYYDAAMAGGSEHPG